MFDAVSKIFSKVAEAMGYIFSPLLELVGNRPWAIALLWLIFLVLWLWLNFSDDKKRHSIDTKNTVVVEAEFRFRGVWHIAAYLTGIWFPISGKHNGISFLGNDLFVGDTKMTLLNFMEWRGFPRLCFMALVIGIVLLTAVYLWLKGPLGVVAALSGLPLSFLSGYIIMAVRVWIETDLLDKLGILRLVFNLFFTFQFEVLPIILFPIMFWIFLQSPSSIAAAAEKYESQYTYTYRPDKSSSDIGEGTSSNSLLPLVIYDEKGRRWKYDGKYSVETSRYKIDAGEILNSYDPIDGQRRTVIIQDSTLMNSNSAYVNGHYFNW